jgi:hypothetical protein
MWPRSFRQGMTMLTRGLTVDDSAIFDLLFLDGVGSPDF